MNFLKKKIKNVVHGKRNKDDDDDDFDNYVPAVPPHPSTLTDNGVSPAGSSQTFFPSFQATFSSITSVADSATKSLAGLTSTFIDSQQEEEPKPEISLEELKAKEEEHKRVEKEKLKQQEESRKDNEEWKYFLSLTAKVEAVTSKTQSALTKFKDDSAVKDLNKYEETAYADKYDQSAPKIAGGWIAFEEQEFNPADPILHQPPPEEPKVEEKPAVVAVDENTQKLARELIDDFGFTTVAPGIPIPAESFSEQQEEIDPFDTSFIDVEAIKSGQVLKPTELLHNLDFTQSELDPFDTSHVEAAITHDLVVGEEDVK